MRVPQFRTGTLMIVIALTALPMAGTAALQRRSRLFHQRAAWHQEQKHSLPLSDLEMYLFITPVKLPPNPSPATLKADQERLDIGESLLKFEEHHDLMTAKYEQAAVRPWLLVEADRPPPSRPSDDDLCGYLERFDRVAISDPILRPIAEEWTHDGSE